MYKNTFAREGILSKGDKDFCDLNQWINELNRLYVIVKGDKKQVDEGFITSWH